MIYLTTGANGAGKTLNTLDNVRKKQLAEGRSVYYHGFDMKPAKAAEFGWLPFEPQKWQDLPDGAILVCDECQKEFPARGASAPVPPYVAALAEHRKRGFDFFLITQHPQLIDMFIRRLIGSPGWHRHLKRVFGADMVTVLEWSAVEITCEKSGASKNAKVGMVPFPKHVYDWYDSAVLHTGKKRIPFKVYLLLGLVVLIPLVFWYGISSINKKASPVPPGANVAGTAPPGQPAVKGPMTTAEYVASYIPRIEGLPQTAPRYDDLTKPTTVPMPAACIKMGDRCDCYSQQATKLMVPATLCLQIVKAGFFDDRLPVASNLAPVRSEPAPLAANSIPEYKPSPVTVAAVAPDPDTSIHNFIHRKPSL